MFNFHIGLPGIASELLNSVYDEGFLTGVNGHYIMPKKLWKERFRSLVNVSPRKTICDTGAWLETAAIVSDLSKYESVAISRHSFLGKPEDCFSELGALPKTTARISRISDVFSSIPLTFHLTISPQFEYLYSVTRNSTEIDSAPTNGMVPSWADLVHRIKASAPHRRILVWDFEQPEKVALPFLISLIGIENSYFVDKLREHLGGSLKYCMDSDSEPENLNIHSRFSNQLDLQYDVDFNLMEQIEGVSVLRPSDILDNFYL